MNPMTGIAIGAVFALSAVATKASAEALCFRTSDCEIGEICQAVRGSAMGICRTPQQAASRQRSLLLGDVGVSEQPLNGWTRPDAGFDGDPSWGDSTIGGENE